MAGELPVDCHVHSEWSWDAPEGSLDGACARAVETGLPGIVFTEHADLTAWFMPDHLHDRLPPTFTARLGDDGVVRPPELDVEAHAAAVAAVRQRYPGLDVRVGVEVSEPHRHPRAVADLRERGRFDLLLGAVHAVDVDGHPQMIESLFAVEDAGTVLRRYLREVLAMVTGTAEFDVLAHIDYPVRSWPADAEPFDPHRFADAFLPVLRALAESGRSLEINTKRPLDLMLLDRWRDAGGPSVTFGSDAHEPGQVGRHFTDIARHAATLGYTPADDGIRWHLR
ncbi:hypothetical protein BJF85_05610 [Saccharomonospora sp. CUA-673]|uniref:PHP domain-containing protein n=1 Tax=Saccharomonospora sp. CUA-673 TaxID=1904969 RepID=UPI000969DECD|nr:PHP domain-containing protein [Saccharomonospora sp. CUA-673]OLT40622.1 hypothetical protein BJF85_05610 [Saccharomonospora sp. CUA-673]